MSDELARADCGMTAKTDTWGSGAKEMAAMTEGIAQMAMMMRSLADMVNATNQRMAALEASVRALTKVTPAQAAEINARVRARAAELCRDYDATGAEARAASAIRKAIRLTCGVSAIRELARSDYTIALEQVELWDDYGIMRKLREGGRKNGEVWREQSFLCGDDARKRGTTDALRGTPAGVVRIWRARAGGLSVPMHALRLLHGCAICAGLLRRDAAGACGAQQGSQMTGNRQ